MNDDTIPSSELSEETLKEKAKTLDPQNQRGRSLINNKPTIQKENFSVNGKRSSEFDRELWESKQDEREKNLSEKSQSIDKGKSIVPEKTLSKADDVIDNIKVGAKWIGKRAIPVIGTALTVKEIYDYAQEFKEQIIDKPPVEEQLKEFHNANPERVPEPPSLEEIQAPENTSSIDKESFMMAMRDSEEMEKPSFLRDLEMPEPETPEMEIGEPSMDSSDGADGGGDGGGE